MFLTYFAPNCQPACIARLAQAYFGKSSFDIMRKHCSFREYTISEIINAVTGSGFTLERFDEHPSWNDPRLPGELTLVAKRPDHHKARPVLKSPLSGRQGALHASAERGFRAIYNSLSMIRRRRYPIGSKSTAPCLQSGHIKSSGSSSPS